VTARQVIQREAHGSILNQALRSWKGGTAPSCRPRKLKRRSWIADTSTRRHIDVGAISKGAVVSESIAVHVDQTEQSAIQFDQSDVLDAIGAATSAELDMLNFGVIGADPDGLVDRYNSWESQAAGISPNRVLGQHLFNVVAPCMNNFMVAQRFEDARSTGSALDVTINYVLTLRMRPTKVRLRLLAAPSVSRRFVLVNWAA
jgi:photoactive yellow protein